MKNLLKETIEKLQSSRRSSRRYLSVLLVLAVVTALGVSWGLHKNGISMTASYVCGYEEHQHTDECYTSVLICGKEESAGTEGHTHTDACYEEQRTLTCTNEDPVHEHTDECYTTERVLICGQEESEGTEGHTHTDACYEKQLTCGKEEHTHTVACYGSDISADVETASDWEATIPFDELTGVWADDLITVAKSQLGYKESTDNFDVDENGNKKGYTRYGAWYGNEYGDWCAMFASFCLNYAGISTDYIPYNSGCAAWIEALTDAGFYHDKTEYDPQPGDLVFFDNRGNDGRSDHVGIVEEVTTDDDGNITAFKTIEGNSSNKVKENSYQTGAAAILGYAALPENPNPTDDAASEAKTASLDFEDEDAENDNDAGVMPTSDNSEGIAVDNYITNVIFQKRVGSLWETSTEFNSTDQVKGTISFANVYTSTLQSNNRTLYVDLPAYIDCSRFTGEYDTYDGSTHSGKYKYERNEDGTYRIVLVLDEDYVNNAGDVIGGNLEFEFYWDNYEEETTSKLPIEIGNWSGEVTVTDDGKPESSNERYYIKKEAGEITYNEGATTAYIEYTVTLEVKQDMTAPVTLKDVLEGEGFTYDTAYGVLATDSAGNSVQANYGTTSGQGTDTQIQLWANKDGKVAAGTYTIKYRVQTLSGIDITNAANLAELVHNTVSVSSEDNISSQTWTKTTTGTVDKTGTLVPSFSGTYIDYTVKLNYGTIIKNLKTPAIFTDTLPEHVSLDGAVTVVQYDVDKNQVSSTTATVNDGTINYTTPTGQYFYVITYRVKVDMESIPLDQETIQNTGTSIGGINDKDTATVPLPAQLTKSLDKNEVSTDSSGRWIDTETWTSSINVTTSLKDYVYEDYAGLMYITDGRYNITTMTDEQFKSIVVKDASGNVVDSSNYTLEKASHIESVWSNTEGKYVDVDSGLFKITFTGDVTGPVTITYQTTSDLSRYTTGAQINVTNHATLTHNGSIVHKQANTNFQYRHDNVNVILKYGDDFNNTGSGSVTLEPGVTSVPWTMQVNMGKSLTDDIVVTDTIVDDMTFLPDTLTIKTYTTDLTTKGATWSYDETTKKLTITIPADAYKNASYNASDPSSKPSDIIFISYRTELPASVIESGETTVTVKNTAEATVDGKTSESTYEQKVTRKVVAKSGIYSDTTRTLQYSLVLNPDAFRLNDGESLKVTDTLSTNSDTDKSILKDITLTSLEVYSVVKYVDESGKIGFKPGTHLRSMTSVTDHPDDFEYMYDQSTQTFTAYIPDGEGYIVIATYSVSSTSVASDILMKNDVKLTGAREWGAQDNTTKITKSTSGQTYTDDKVTVVKHDQADGDTLLAGAKFTLQKYNLGDGEWSTVGEAMTTNSSGLATWHNVEYNTLYKLVEEEAPSDYVKDSTPTYFVIVRQSGAGTAKDNLPESIVDESNYSKSAVSVYTVQDNTEKTETTEKATYYANVVINRYNKQDENKVEPGQLRVTKEWLDASGNLITDATKLSSMPDVTVTLTKHVNNTGKTVTIKAGTWDNAQSLTLSNLNDGCYLIFNLGQLENQPNISDFNCTDSTVTFTDLGIEGDYHRWKVGPISQDCTIIQGVLAYKTESDVSQEGGTPATGTTDTVIGTVTLNSANDWSYLWSSLDRTDGVSYTLTETAVSGYTATYKINDNDLAAGGTFTPGTSGDRITVTNAADRTYKLPESGGIGTKVFTAGGLAIIAAGLMYGYSLRRRRKRGGE